MNRSLARLASSCLLVIFTVSCASAPPRAPANLPNAAEVDGRAMAPPRETFRDVVASKAFVLAPPDAQGVEALVCQIDLSDYPGSTPGFLNPAKKRDPLKLDVPACSAEQRHVIFEVASNANRGQVAGGAVWLGACALDFALVTVVMAAYTRTHARAAPDSSVKPLTPKLATQTAPLAASAYELLDKSRPGRGPRAVAGMVCAGWGALLGQKIGYFLTPAGS